MADVERTLSNSGDSVTCKGYVIDSCNNDSKVYDGSWSPTSATGMTVSTSGSSITITHKNTSTSSVSATFTWTSSKVSGCSKTLSVTAVGKPATTTVYCTISLSCSLKYEDSECHGYGSSTDADFDVQCDNYTELYWTGNYAAMPEGLSTRMDLGYRTTEYTDITSLSGVIEVSLSGYFMTSTSSIRISFGGDATGSKTFYGNIRSCENSSGGSYYHYSGGSARGHFNSSSTSISISVSIG